MNMIFVLNTYKPKSMPISPNVYTPNTIVQSHPININASRFNMNNIFAARGRPCG